jgi:hypothetical protein
MKAELSLAKPSKRIARLEASLNAKLHICYFEKLDSQIAFDGSQRFEK